MRMSKKLGVEFYDREIVEEAAKKLNLPVSKIDEIEEKKAKEEALFASIGEGIIAIDKKGKIIIVNPGSLSLPRDGKTGTYAVGTIDNSTLAGVQLCKL